MQSARVRTIKPLGTHAVNTHALIWLAGSVDQLKAIHAFGAQSVAIGRTGCTDGPIAIVTLAEIGSAAAVF